jgi:hypothetical protein
VWVPGVVPKMQLSPEIGELQICLFMSDLSKSLESVSEPLSECSSAGSSAGSLTGSGGVLYWCMSGLSCPMYGWRTCLSCSSSCHCPWCSITAVGLPCSLFSGTYSRMLYPLVLFECPAGTSCTLLLVLNIDPVASCCRIQMHSLQLLPVLLELAMIERSRV